MWGRSINALELNSTPLLLNITGDPQRRAMTVKGTPTPVDLSLPKLALPKPSSCSIVKCVQERGCTHEQHPGCSAVIPAGRSHCSHTKPRSDLKDQRNFQIGGNKEGIFSL